MEKSQVKGYKIFDENWKCRDKQYTCPGRFKEDVEPKAREIGMHFYLSIVDCLDEVDTEYWYRWCYGHAVRIAEVIAHGETDADESPGVSKICCTNDLEIVREISMDEAMAMSNIGVECYGYGNTGNGNHGNCNAGFYNNGYSNTGCRNTGDCNSGSGNTGDYNTGHRNIGNHNTGDDNKGNCNTGRRNKGNRNTGDYNVSSYNVGCFNTEEPKLTMFNKPSDWTYDDWRFSLARRIIYRIISGELDWSRLVDEEKDVIRSLPNFDPDIFEKCTGIKVS